MAVSRVSWDGSRPPRGDAVQAGHDGGDGTFGLAAPPRARCGALIARCSTVRRRGERVRRARRDDRRARSTPVSSVGILVHDEHDGRVQTLGHTPLGHHPAGPGGLRGAITTGLIRGPRSIASRRAGGDVRRITSRSANCCGGPFVLLITDTNRGAPPHPCSIASAPPPAGSSLSSPRRRRWARPRHRPGVHRTHRDHAAGPRARPHRSPPKMRGCAAGC